MTAPAAIITGSIARVRWHAPDGRAGSWGRSVDALIDAVRAATGQRLNPNDKDEWKNVGKLWRGMQGQGWTLESERARE